MSVSIAGKDTIKSEGSFDGRLSHELTLVAARHDDRPWWLPATDFQPLQPGEHPRLLFRKSNVELLRKKAQTPEGKAIIARLRTQLNGGAERVRHCLTVAFWKDPILFRYCTRQESNLQPSVPKTDALSN